MKKTFSLLIVLFLSIYSVGQNNELTDSLINAAEQLPDDTNKVNLLIRLGKQHDLYASKEHISYYMQSLELAKEIKFKRALRRIYPQLISDLYERNMFEMALDHCMEFIEFCTLEKYDEEKIKVYNMMGNLLARKGKHKEALHYYNLKKAHDLKTEDYRSYAMSLNNLSNYFYETDQYDSALVYSLWAVQMLKRNNMASETGQALLNAAQVNLKKQQYPEVLEKAGEAVEVYSAIELPQGLSKAYYFIGEGYAGSGSVDSAFIAFGKALHLADSLHLLKVQRDCYTALSRMYAGTKNYKDAYEYSLLANRYEDSTTVAVEKGRLMEMETRYELEKMRKVTAEKQFTKIDAKIDKTIFLVCVCAGMVLVARRFVRKSASK